VKTLVCAQIITSGIGNGDWQLGIPYLLGKILDSVRTGSENEACVRDAKASVFTLLLPLLCIEQCCTALHMNARSSADYRQELPFSTPCWFRLGTEISTSEQPMLVLGGAATDTEVKAHLHLRNPVNAWHNRCLKPLQVGSGHDGPTRSDTR
jgi:hypothetical protein